MILLTDEEMEIAVNKWKNEDWATRHIRLDRGHYEDVLPLIAKAQLKKALQEVEDYITRDLEWANEENEMLWKNKLKIWRQALLKEAQ